MKKLMICLFSMLAIGSISAQKKSAKTTTTVPQVGLLKNLLDSFSYAAGVNIATSMKQQGINNINLALMQKGLNDILTNKPSALSPEGMNDAFQRQMKISGEISAKAAKAKEAVFFNANKKKAGIIELPSGIQYEVIKAGVGTVHPKAIDTVVVNYIGTLTNGTEFDNSIKRGSAATFPLNGVIKGWTEILQHMVIGDKWKVYIPSELAYGKNPPPGANIPPSSILEFEITLEGIKEAK